MNRWRAEYDDGIWCFYRDGIELGLYEKGDVVVDALNVAESRIAELEAERRWRVVADGELPEEYRNQEDGELIPFLVCAPEAKLPFRAVYDGDEWGNGWDIIPVTHWMRLPEPPIVYGKEREE